MRNVRERVDVNQAVVLCGGLGTRLGKLQKNSKTINKGKQ